LEVATIVASPAALALGHSLLGISLRFRGQLSDAREELETALRYRSSSDQGSAAFLGFDHYNWASIALARALWLQGFPSRAAVLVKQTVKDAERIEHPVTLAIALVWAALVLQWTGDLLGAEEYTMRLIAHAASHSLAPYHAIGRGLNGQLSIRSGDAVEGIGMLEACLDELHAARYESLTTAFNISLAQGLVMLGRFTEGMTLVEETIELVEENGETAYMPELLRVKGEVILSMPNPNSAAAEECFIQSLRLSRCQGGRAWELRTAVDLATLWADQGRSADARAVLQPVFEQFAEGSDTTDLAEAGRLLAHLD